jgi:histidine triad (HIT) family protein
MVGFFHARVSRIATRNDDMSDCLFCKIAAGDLPCNKIDEDDDFLAFHDIHPKAPVHALVIPKAHVDTLADADDPAMLGRLMDRVRRVAEILGVADAGYRVVINVRDGGGQEIYHLHAHILGGKRLPF